MEKHSKFARANAELLEAYRSIPASIAGDAMRRRRCTTGAITPINSRVDSTAGTVLTVETPGGSNYAVHKALEEVESGDVLVVDAEGNLNRAVWGELMSRFSIREGLSAVVIDGAIRDVDVHFELNFPVYCRGATPKGPLKIDRGTIGKTVDCDGVSVDSGDIAVCDGDGVAFVPSSESSAVLEACQRKLDQEDKWMEAADNSDKTTLEIIGADQQG